MYRKERAQWNKNSEKALLLVWSKNIERLRAHRKNSHVVKEMVNELRAHGFEFSALEIKIKIQNLTSRYRKEKQGIKKSFVSADGWDIVKEMDVLFKHKKQIVFDNINNINSSTLANPLSPSSNTSSFAFKFESTASFPTKLESAATPSLLKPLESPLSSRFSESSSSSSDTSLHAAKKRKKDFDQFFQNLEQTMAKINDDIKTTIDKIIIIEEKKQEMLSKYIEKEGKVQDALLEFLKRN